MTRPSSEKSTSSSVFWAESSLLAIALIWGINIPIMKTGLEAVDKFQFNAIRLVISAATLVLFAVRERRRASYQPSSVRLSELIIYSLMVSLAYQLLFLFGLNGASAGNTALILATTPMWTALLASLFLGEALTRMAWMGLVVAMTGTMIVAVQKGVSTDSRYLVGNLLVLAAALVWAAGTVYSRPLLKRISSIQLAAWAASIALPVHVLVALFRPWDELSQFNTTGIWLTVLYAGVLSSGLTQPMWHFGVRIVGAAHAAIIQNLIPLIALLAAWATRGETPTGSQLFGGALILLGLVAMRRGRT